MFAACFLYIWLIRKMKRFIVLVILLSTGMAGGVLLDRSLTSTADEHQETALEHAKKHLDPNYVCPMHSQIVSGEPGSCPICGMDLVRIKKSESSEDNSHDAYPTVRVSSTMINNMGVRVTQVKRKTLVRQIETPGFIQRIMPEKYIRYTAPAKGRVSKLYFTGNKFNRKGDPLIDIELDDLVPVQEKYLELLSSQTPQSSQQKQLDSDAAANMEVEEQVKSNDPADAQPSDNIPEDNATSQQASESVAVQKEQAESGLTLEKVHRLLLLAGMTEKQIKTLEQTGKTSPVITLYASHEGRVKKARVEVGDEVKPRQMLFVLGGLMRVNVLANAFQRDASWVRAGQDVDIILPHDSTKPFKGKVKTGAVSINTNSQNIGIELTFVAPDELVKSGMYVVGNIYGQVRKDTLTIPRDAVIYSRNEKRVILALGEGKFKPVVIETGISNDTEIEVLSGLEEGDTVVVSAQFFLDSESSLQASYRRIKSIEY